MCVCVLHIYVRMKRHLPSQERRGLVLGGCKCIYICRSPPIFSKEIDRSVWLLKDIAYHRWLMTTIITAANTHRGCCDWCDWSWKHDAISKTTSCENDDTALEELSKGTIDECHLRRSCMPELFEACSPKKNTFFSFICYLAGTG